MSCSSLCVSQVLISRGLPRLFSGGRLHKSTFLHVTQTQHVLPQSWSSAGRSPLKYKSDGQLTHLLSRPAVPNQTFTNCLSDDQQQLQYCLVWKGMKQQVTRRRGWYHETSTPLWIPGVLVSSLLTHLRPQVTAPDYSVPGVAASGASEPLRTAVYAQVSEIGAVPSCTQPQPTAGLSPPSANCRTQGTPHLVVQSRW